MSPIASRPTATRSSPSPMPARLARLGADAAVRGRSRMGDRGLGVAEIGGDRNHARRVHHAPRRLAPALDVERHDRAAAALLPFRQRVLRMRRADPGSTRARRRVPLPASCASSSAACRLRVHADAQRLQALQQHPGVERRQGRARRCAGTRTRRPSAHRALPEHRAAQHPALPVEVLGRRMDHDVRAELERPLQRRRAEAVVHRQQRAARFAHARQARRCRRSRSADSTASRGTAAWCSGAARSRQAATSVPATKVVSTPNLPMMLANSCTVAPNMLRRAQHMVARLQQAHGAARGSPTCRKRSRRRPRRLPAPPGAPGTRSPSDW